MFLCVTKINDDGEGYSVSVTVLSLDTTSHESLFLEMLLVGPGVEMVVSIFFSRGEFFC